MTTTILALDLGNRRIPPAAFSAVGNDNDNFQPAASAWHWRDIPGWPDSSNPMCKLDEIDREAIRRMKRLGIPRTVIAEGYGVHKRTVFRVLASMERGCLQ